MTDDQDAIRSLNREQLLERAKAGQLETEYWRQVIADLRGVQEGVAEIADELAASTLAVLGLLPLVEQVGMRPLERIVEANRVSMVRLRGIQQLTAGTLELVDGRSTVLLETVQAIADSLGIELDERRGEAES